MRPTAVLTSLGSRLVVAHRGDSLHAPENSLESFDRAIALRADAIEFDVRLTRDGVPVVIHDATVDRTTDGHGPVDGLTLVDLRRLDAGARFTRDGVTFPYRGLGLAVPTLHELLERYRETPLLIEVKLPDAVEPTWRELERAGAVGRTVVDSMMHEAVVPFRGRMATGASMRDVLALLARACVPLASSPARLPYDAICIPRRYRGFRVPVARLARLTRGAGVPTHVWTVNEPDAARALWRAGVQGIVTDDPGTMLGVRDRLDADGVSSGAGI